MAAEIKEEVGLPNVLGDGLNDGINRGKQLGDQTWHLFELSDQLSAAFERERVVQLGEAQCQQVHHCHLTDESLRCSDRNLKPCSRVEHAVSIAGGLRAHDVGDRHHRRAALLGDSHRSQRVCRLARLGDANHKIPRTDDWIAVAVLGGNFYVDRHASELFDRVAADQPGVVRSTAGDDDDPLGAA